MFMRMAIAVGRCLKRKIMLVWAKQYINKNFASCKSLCSLQVLYAAFKENDPNVNIGFWNFSKITQSVSVCSTHQNVVLLVDAMDWDLTYKYPIKKIFYNPEDNKYIMYRCESRPGTATPKDFLNQELSEHEDDKKFNYYQWDTMDRTIFATFTATYEEVLVLMTTTITQAFCIKFKQCLLIILKLITHI